MHWYLGELASPKIVAFAPTAFLAAACCDLTLIELADLNGRVRVVSADSRDRPAQQSSPHRRFYLPGPSGTVETSTISPDYPPTPASARTPLPHPVYSPSHAQRYKPDSNSNPRSKPPKQPSAQTTHPASPPRPLYPPSHRLPPRAAEECCKTRTGSPRKSRSRSYILSGSFPNLDRNMRVGMLRRRLFVCLSRGTLRRQQGLASLLRLTGSPS